jgi:hypothetical protein
MEMKTTPLLLSKQRGSGQDPQALPLPAGPKFTPTLGILIILLIWATVSQMISALSWGHTSYELTEWLINYSGGFVRRGLPGTLIGMISSSTGIQANYLVLIAGLVTYLCLAVWLLRRATANFPATLILSCIMMGIPAYQNSIIRKDCLGLLFLLGCLTVERTRLVPALRIAVMNLLAVAAILCHETFVFYALAGFILFQIHGQASRSMMELLRRAACLLPAGVCLMITAIYHGTPEQARLVNDSWVPLWRILDPGNPGVTVPAATIAALGWTTEHGISLSIHMLTSGFYQPLAWVMVFTISFFLMILFTDRSLSREKPPATNKRIQVTSILLAQLVFISPLFLLGVDYGRWLFLWLVSSVVFYTMDRRAPLWLEAIVSKMFATARVPSLLARIPARDWYLLFFVVPVCWNSYNFLVASPVLRHLDIIRSWF